MPGWSASTTSGWLRLGTASAVPANCGIQKLWITSRELMSSTTFCPAGSTRSLAVTMSTLPSWSRSYSNDHHHCDEPDARQFPRHPPLPPALVDVSPGATVVTDAGAVVDVLEVVVPSLPPVFS